MVAVAITKQLIDSLMTQYVIGLLSVRPLVYLVTGVKQK
ncbi:hypothetical protein GCHA_4017 [Paraglaciecola chathamensis S18K6]|uniref:Uncharacterized protein n=2 Tax=Paraglaciecola chathamensis TaxID=368405 RepID=A0ABQ0IDR0_9ALTE|nr:hypothetical protein GAGA_4698 [Paraglaciecola agarilytica NO2]GAC11943.1 hypothetical protein GCHA_4017 [Paraglaciecola chathamensis S18K6]